jgi:SAM-dependent methyltransferase
MRDSAGLLFHSRSFYKKLRPDYQLLLGYFIVYGGLRRDHEVLDVGCGQGRMARELIAFLSPMARYEGFDVRGDAIEKLQRRLTPQFKNFRFQHANIYNQRYNPEGTVASTEYVFPFKSERFDFVFLTSIFTHLVPAEMEHYLAEIARVLKTGGRCAITYFLLNEQSIQVIESGVQRKSFPHKHGHYRLQTADEPEHAVAVDEAYVRAMYERHGLRVLDPIHYGGWSRREGAQMPQDMVIAIKQ